MQVLRTVLRWVLPTIAGLLFVVVGAVKFVDRSWVINFTRWGYPPYFYLVVGLVEVGGGLGLLVPSFRVRAAITLAAVMLAAILTAVVYAEPRFARTAAVYLLLCLVIASTHRRSADDNAPSQSGNDRHQG